MVIQRTVIGTNGAPTFGTMTMRDGTYIGVTLERPIDDPVHPCIPAGLYCVDKAMHHPGEADQYEVPELDTSHLVPPRSYIQIHILNRVSQSLGCIGPGENVAADGVEIEHSEEAFGAMMAAIGTSWPFTLEIRDP